MGIEDESDEEECLLTRFSSKKWYLDSGCSRHITGDSRNFSSIHPRQKGSVIFGDNSKGRIMGVWSIYQNRASMEKVIFVQGLKHNLMSVSQLCDNRMRVIFEATRCIVENMSTRKTIFSWETWRKCICCISRRSWRDQLMSYCKHLRRSITLA